MAAHSSTAGLDAVTEDTSTTTSTSGTTTTPVVVSAPPLARTPTNTVRNQSKSRQCRNVLIHGHCKFEGKGCQFLHEVSPKASPAASVGPGIITKDNWDNRPRPGSAAIPIMPHPTSRIGSATDVSAAAATTNPTTTGTTTGQKISVASPVFTPSRTPLVAAAVTEAQPIRSIPSLTYSPQQLYGSSTQTPELMPHLSQPDPARYHQQYGYGFYDQADQYAGMHMIQGGIKSMGLGQQQSNMQEQSNYQDNAQLENFFMHQQTNTPYLPLQYHLYNSALPKVSNLPSNIKSSHYFFIDDNLRENLLKRNEAVQKVLDPSVPDGPNLPITVDSYHTLFPLEDSSTPSKIFGYPTSVYKAIRSVDGKPYILRRIEGFRMMNAATMACLESWRHVRHANVVSFIEAFTTKAFGDSSLVLVYDYHPLASTMAATYFSRNDLPTTKGVEERVIWSFICQLTSALRTIHMQNLAARVVDFSKVVVTGKNRFSLNCCGVMDILTFEAKTSVLQLQQEDMRNLGQLIVSLAVGSPLSLQNIQKCLDHLGRNYSSDMVTVAMYLLSNTPTPKSLDEVSRLIAPRLLQEVNDASQYNDRLEDELSRELENARLVRLLCKLGFINERPEYDLDLTWAETGDVYLLKLFRDYVFHQVDEAGAPLLDLAHVLQTLNKLDVGVDEKIMLTSRDEKSCLIASYRDLKQCIDTTFREMISRRGRQK
ncbi:hypothetical protein BASA62_004697 [Batrachochytrium salamandrivorans]|nr:hypothetical protein BASA62_004697 [Batrachochytrium salamandrivorans]